MRKSWKLEFAREWWPYMSLRSLVTFSDYKLRSERGELVKGNKLRLRMRSPIRGEIILREMGSDVPIFDEIFVEQVYKGVLSCLDRCEYVIDLGANIGLSSLYFANHYPKCKVVAVEPHPATYDILCANLSKLVKAGRCKTLNAAVWASDAVLVGEQPENPEHYSVFTTREVSSPVVEGEAILGMPIRQIITAAGFDRIDLLKVDIEGAEVELFKGDLEWLRVVRCIAIEFHAGSREATGFDEIMAQYGFRIFDGGSHTVVAVRAH